MLGLKIISKCQFRRMNKHIENLTEENLSLKASLDECKSNAKELYDENHSLKEQLRDNEFRNLKDLAIIKNDNYPCQGCHLESKDCKKLVFDNQTICVVKKDKMNSFRKKRVKKQ